MLPSKGSKTVSFLGEQPSPQSRLQQFLTGLKRFLNDQGNFEGFYLSCLAYLRTKIPHFQEAQLNDTHVTKYVLHLAKNKGLKIDNKAQKRACEQEVQGFLHENQLLQRRYSELADQQAQEARRVLAQRPSVTAQPAERPDRIGSAAALARLSDSPSQRTPPQSIMTPRAAALLRGIEAQRSAQPHVAPRLLPPGHPRPHQPNP